MHKSKDAGARCYSKGTAYVKKKAKSKMMPTMNMGMLKPKNTAVKGRNSGRGDSGGMNGNSQ